MKIVSEKTLYIRKRKDVNKGQEVITVVSRLNKETRMLEFGYSICCKEDVFKKSFGRRLATQRLNQQKNFYMRFKYPGNLNHIEINQFVIDKINARFDWETKFYNFYNNLDLLDSDGNFKEKEVVLKEKLFGRIINSVNSFLYKFYHI